jgi:hypothetical protein
MMRSILAAGLLLASANSGLTQGQVVCSPPTITTERKACGGDTFQTYAKVTNSCQYCDVEVTVHLRKGGTALLNAKKKDSKREMIGTYSSTEVAYDSADYKFTCPNSTTTTNISRKGTIHTKNDLEERTKSKLWAAMATSPTDAAWGASWDNASGGDAERVALSECSGHGSGCTIVGTFSKGCMALASCRNGPNGGSHGLWWDGGETKDEATTRVILRCQKHSSPNCYIRKVVCQ